jgi:hypothetical protein
MIVPGVFLMQVGIRIQLGPSFYQFPTCNLFWVPWDREGVALAHGVRESSPQRGHSTAHKRARPDPDGANRQRPRLLAAQEDEPQDVPDDLWRRIFWAAVRVSDALHAAKLAPHAWVICE